MQKEEKINISIHNCCIDYVIYIHASYNGSEGYTLNKELYILQSIVFTQFKSCLVL